MLMGYGGVVLMIQMKMIVQTIFNAKTQVSGCFFSMTAVWFAEILKNRLFLDFAVSATIEICAIAAHL